MQSLSNHTPPSRLFLPVNVSNHVESNLWQVVELASQDLFESRDCLGNGDELAGVAGEHLSDDLVIKDKILLSNEINYTWKVWERNLSIFLALATLSLSSSDNSSIPRIAMMSWRDLQSWKILWTLLAMS